MIVYAQLGALPTKGVNRGHTVRFTMTRTPDPDGDPWRGNSIDNAQELVTLYMTGR